MLLMILLGMMHNAFPHVHHEHEHVGKIEVGNEIHHHDHDTDHHHSDESEKDNNRSFLGFLFNDHSHTKHTYQYSPFTVEHLKSMKQDVKVFESSHSWVFEECKTDLGLQRNFLSKELIRNNPYLHTYRHRGPPSLG